MGAICNNGQAQAVRPTKCAIKVGIDHGGVLDAKVGNDGKNSDSKVESGDSNDEKNQIIHRRRSDMSQYETDIKIPEDAVSSNFAATSARLITQILETLSVIHSSSRKRSR